MEYDAHSNVQQQTDENLGQNFQTYDAGNDQLGAQYSLDDFEPLTETNHESVANTHYPEPYSGLLELVDSSSAVSAATAVQRLETPPFVEEPIESLSTKIIPETKHDVSDQRKITEVRQKEVGRKIEQQKSTDKTLDVKREPSHVVRGTRKWTKDTLYTNTRSSTRLSMVNEHKVPSTMQIANRTRRGTNATNRTGVSKRTSFYPSFRTALDFQRPRRTHPHLRQLVLGKTRAIRKSPPIIFASRSITESGKFQDIVKLTNLVDEQKALNEALVNENKTLKIINQRQERAIKKMDKDVTEIPQIIHTFNEQLRVLKNDKRLGSERIQQLERSSQVLLEENLSLKDKLNRATGILRSKNLDDNDKLQETIQSLTLTIAEKDHTIQELKKSLNYAKGERNVELRDSRNRAAKIAKESEDLRLQNERLSTKLRERDRTIAALTVQLGVQHHRHQALHRDDPLDQDEMSENISIGGGGHLTHSRGTSYQSIESKASKMSKTVRAHAAEAPLKKDPIVRTEQKKNEIFEEVQKQRMDPVDEAAEAQGSESITGVEGEVHHTIQKPFVQRVLEPPSGGHVRRASVEDSQTVRKREHLELIATADLPKSESIEGEGSGVSLETIDSAQSPSLTEKKDPEHSIPFSGTGFHKPNLFAKPALSSSQTENLTSTSTSTFTRPIFAANIKPAGLSAMAAMGSLPPALGSTARLLSANAMSLESIAEDFREDRNMEPRRAPSRSRGASTGTSKSVPSLAVDRDANISNISALEAPSISGNEASEGADTQDKILQPEHKLNFLNTGFNRPTLASTFADSQISSTKPTHKLDFLQQKEGDVTSVAAVDKTKTSAEIGSVAEKDVKGGDLNYTPSFGASENENIKVGRRGLQNGLSVSEDGLNSKTAGKRGSLGNLTRSAIPKPTTPKTKTGSTPPWLKKSNKKISPKETNGQGKNNGESEDRYADDEFDVEEVIAA
ncbi:ciliary protein causing Leber congenital amaurosis disease-domain-containing protein [Cladochytrium replicatum]|nr:ciliary protein causing Leber congenital amaurosis disease-domain-containing protein [Cladochytrium replicatum]